MNVSQSKPRPCIIWSLWYPALHPFGSTHQLMLYQGHPRRASWVVGIGCANSPTPRAQFAS